MPYNITITIQGGDPKAISKAIAAIVEDATGQKVDVFIRRRPEALKPQETREKQRYGGQ